MRILGVTASSFELYGAYESIATATGTGSSGTITFSSIPSTYQHLQIRCLVRCSNTGTFASLLRIRVGSGSIDSGTNYARHQLYGDGSTVIAAGTATTDYISAPALVVQNGAAANNHGVVILDIHDYASTTKNKTLRLFAGQDLNGTGVVSLDSGLWMNTSAINQIQIYIGADNFTTSSTFALYGYKGA